MRLNSLPSFIIIFTSRLEVTLGKKVEGIEWKCVLRQKDKKLSTSLPLSESLKDLSKEELERAKDLLRGLSGDKVRGWGKRGEIYL